MITSPRAAARDVPRRNFKRREKRGASLELNGFDEEYERKVTEARERARAQGRGDVVDYLTLRAANDAMRARGAEWLLGAFTSVAGEMNREGASLTFARTEAHRFRVGHSTMVGPRLVLSRGLRSLTIEAGWPRGPRDGIVRGGGLASALVGHFGNRKADEELVLLPFEDEPRWLILEKTGARTEFFEDRVRTHLNRLLI
jgi:hypothetical protein